MKSKYEYICNIKDDEKLRASFNELTKKTFWFDFEDWYQKGHWQDKYIPHVLVDNGKVVSNVSVNLMQFVVDGERRNYIQLGTVMTDPDYRGQGLNQYIMERILEEYSGKVDGIYLFGNDSVLEYYPKFGFKSAMEYTYTCKWQRTQSVEREESYTIEKVDLSDEDACKKLYDTICECDGKENPNDGFYMCNNLGLYQFWLAAEYEQSVYRVPEIDGYVIADKAEKTLVLHQIIAKQMLNIEKFVNAFGEEITDIKLEYTPTNKEAYEVNEFKEEDSTLFVMGVQLEEDLDKKILFPIMSHA